MDTRLLYLLFILLGNFTSKAQRFDLKMTLEGVDREYIVVKPSGNPPAQGYPVVFMLHGTTGDGEKFYTISGWKELGEKEKFITVYPSSLAYCVTLPSNHVVTKWNNGDLISQLCANQSPKNDVLFIRAVMDSVKSRFPVNASRCFMAGFSNGGVMSAKIAVELGDVFAASICGSGALHALDAKVISKKIPIWFLIGCEDENIIDAFGRALPFNDSAQLVMKGLINVHLQSLELENTYRKDSLLGSLSYTYTTPKQGASPGYFRFTCINKMDHIWPNGVNFQFNIVPIAWAWFNSFGSTSAATPFYENIQRLECYPNPAAETFIVKIPTAQLAHFLKIWDADGKLIGTEWIQAGTHELRLETNRFGSGWKTLQLQNAQGTWQEKLLIINQ